MTARRDHGIDQVQAPARTVAEAQPALPAQLAVVVPTFNERDNVQEVIRRVGEALEGVAWEIIFVDDDSPDGTADLVAEIARRDPRVRVLRRIGRRGLTSACVEGICSTHCPYVAVMDADLQHDETLLKAMHERAVAERLDLVIGSRFVGGGSYGDMPPARQAMSRLATWLGSSALRTGLSDPMSGFFMVRRETFLRHVGRMSGRGFKILLDYVATARGSLSIAELPYRMRARHAGASKLDTLVLWEYLLLILEKSIGRYVPIRFLFLVPAGAAWALFHTALLWGGLFWVGAGFMAAQAAAVLVALGVRFAILNRFTRADRRRRGLGMVTGLGLYYLSSALGVALNLAVAGYLFGRGVEWWAAGLLGLLAGVAVNHALRSE